MNIMLIKPSQEAFFHTIERHYPVGLLYIAKALTDAGHNVTVLDCLAYRNNPHAVDSDQLLPTQREKLQKSNIFSKVIHFGCDWSDVEEVIAKTRPDIIGMSIMFSCFYDLAYEWCNKIKMRFPKMIIVAGGAHISAYYKHALDHDYIDYCLRYEGEISFPKLVNCIQNGITPYQINGIAFRDQFRANEETLTGISIYSNSEQNWITDLDNLYPQLDLLDCSNYSNTVTLITSRGCPYGCKFCLVSSTMGKVFRKRSPYSIIEEIKRYNDRGIYSFNIEDDNFSYDIDRVVNLFQLIIKHNISANYYLLNGIIARNIDEQNIALFARAGVKKLFFGLESTSEKLRREIQKTHANLVEIRRAVFLANRYGIEAGVSLIIGFPFQTLDDILLDIVTLYKNHIPPLAINALYPLPNTPIYDECVREGFLTGHEDYTLLGGDNFPIHNNFFNDEDLYLLWVAVRAITKWSWRFGDWEFEELPHIECMQNICKQINGVIVNAYDDLIVVEFDINELKNEILSYNYKIWVDMVSTYLFLYSGQEWNFCVIDNNSTSTLIGKRRENLYISTVLNRLRYQLQYVARLG